MNPIDGILVKLANDGFFGDNMNNAFHKTWPTFFDDCLNSDHTNPYSCLVFVGHPFYAFVHAAQVKSAHSIIHLTFLASQVVSDRPRQSFEGDIQERILLPYYSALWR